MTTRDRDYQLMMSALADAARRRDRALQDAERLYQDSSAQAAGELARAEGEAAAADRWAGAAAAQVLDVDEEAARLWERLRRARGIHLRALGELPAPAPVESLPRLVAQRRPVEPEPAGVLLTRVAERIDQRPPMRRALPRWALPLLPMLGAVAAGCTGLLAAGLVTFGETVGVAGAVVRGAGWLAFLVAPSAGIPVAAALAHRRMQARLDLVGIGLLLLGGMAAATFLSLTFAASH